MCQKISVDELIEWMENTFKWLCLHNPTVAKKKYKFMKDQLTYVGCTLPKDGVSPEQIKFNQFSTSNHPATLRNCVHSSVW